jgi:hypothetical protein
VVWESNKGCTGKPFVKREVGKETKEHLCERKLGQRGQCKTEVRRG